MIEKIYNDFTTQLLPKIQDGMVIGKEYFTDLFGRYVKYLIVHDSIQIVLNLFLLVGTSYALYRIWKWASKNNNMQDEAISIGVIIGTVVGVIMVLFSFIGVVSNIDDLVKDIYIPEVRVYEELSNYLNPEPKL